MKTAKKSKRRANSNRIRGKVDRSVGMLLSMHAEAGSGHAAKPPVSWEPSPNFASREGADIDSLVLHNTDGTLASAVARFKDPAQQVSAHYIVDRDGSIVQMVQDASTAWHSGNKPMNQRSIGIEVVAWVNAQGMTASQEANLIALGRFIREAYDVSVERIFPHRAIKPTQCPGWVWSTDAAFNQWCQSKLG